MFFPPGFNMGFPGQGGDDEEDDFQDDDDGDLFNQESLYKILGVASNAGLDAITVNYELFKAKHGPEGQQPNPDKIEQLKEAYEVLSDPQQREMYDTSLKQQQEQANLIKMMMGGGMGGHGSKKGKKELPKMQPTKRGIQLTLEDLYLGKTVELPHERSRLCGECAGKGGVNVNKCKDCKGEGGTVKLVQLGPGMFTQAQETCATCNGTGDNFGEEGHCKACEGKKIAVDKAVIPVKVEPGAPPGQIISLQGEGNQVPDARPGDLLLVVQEKAHDLYSRKGADLFMKKHISLVQALLGCYFKFQHINGKEYTAYTAPGEVVGDADRKVLVGLGMPFYRDGESRFGNLIVDFKIDMPKRGDLSAQQLKVLAKALPGKQTVRPEGHDYEMLQDFDREQLNTNEQGGKRDDEDEDMEGKEAVECGAQ